jgi:uncharacterized membrane protein YhaH (DUF805 family)
MLEDLLWIVDEPWERVVFAVLFILLTVSALTIFLLRHRDTHSPGVALRLAVLKTVAMLILYMGSLWTVFSLVARYLPPGTERLWVGGGLWSVTAWLLTEIIWPFVSHAIEALFS